MRDRRSGVMELLLVGGIGSAAASACGSRLDPASGAGGRADAGSVVDSDFPPPR